MSRDIEPDGKELTVYVDPASRLQAAETESAALLLRRLRTSQSVERGIDHIRRLFTEIADEVQHGYFRDPAAYLRGLPPPAADKEAPPVSSVVQVLEAIRDGVRFDPYAQANSDRHVPEGAQVISFLTDPSQFHLVHSNGAYAGFVAGRALSPEQTQELFAAFYTPASNIYTMAKSKLGFTDDGRGRSGIREKAKRSPKDLLTARGMGLRPIV